MVRKAKLRFEFYDEDGNKIVLSIQGRITPDLILRYASLFSSPPSTEDFETHSSIFKNMLRILSELSSSSEWFTSEDVQSLYEARYGVSIKLSTVSTYLQRLTEQGVLYRRKTGRFYNYKILNRSLLV
ncbi:hypothetical protein B6U74_00300 [Candidatus Bathyarchaeota archaeon ex4484_205]|nr:MAG: hypothetical protein B6U74_00300 [Candidatus Bathyarchaeota archaeon ex4484_205]RLG69445.1 MAG: hypothetical protein DRN93_00040 [archaeon]